MAKRSKAQPKSQYNRLADEFGPDNFSIVVTFRLNLANDTEREYYYYLEAMKEKGLSRTQAVLEVSEVGKILTDVRQELEEARAEIEHLQAALMNVESIATAQQDMLAMLESLSRNGGHVSRGVSPEIAKRPSDEFRRAVEDMTPPLRGAKRRERIRQAADDL